MTVKEMVHDWGHFNETRFYQRRYGFGSVIYFDVRGNPYYSKYNQSLSDNKRYFFNADDLAADDWEVYFPEKTIYIKNIKNLEWIDISEVRITYTG